LRPRKAGAWLTSPSWLRSSGEAEASLVSGVACGSITAIGSRSRGCPFAARTLAAAFG
jgi:hypothetical protein